MMMMSAQSEVKITLEDRSVIPKAEEQVIEAGAGFDGLGVVTVVGDENFIAKNIKNGVKIWGITGTGVAPPFAASAVGVIPYVYKGTARSTGLDFSGLFETSAVGALANEGE